MANVDKAYGLRPMGNLSATGAQKQYGYIIADNQSGAIYQGDLVTLVGGFLVRYVSGTHATAVGVFNGCSYIDPTSGKPTWSNYYPGSVNNTPNPVTVNIYIDGALVRTFNETLTTEDQDWYVCEIDWPSGTVTPL